MAKCPCTNNYLKIVKGNKKMKIKLYKAHNVMLNKWFTFKDSERLNKFISRPCNHRYEFKIYMEFEPERKYEQLKLDI